MEPWKILVVAALAASLACASPPERSRPAPPAEPAPEPMEERAMNLPTAPGQHRVTLNLAGEDTRVTIWLPAATDPSDARPLILSLHYGGDVTPFYGAGLLEQLVLPALEGLNGVIVAPDRGPGGWGSDVNVARLGALLEACADAYAIDRERILLTGYSMGGIGTWAIAEGGRLPVTAAIPIAGRPGDGTPSIPTYAIQSADDELFAVSPVERAVGRLRAAGVPTELTVLDGPGHYDIGAFQAALTEAGRWVEARWAE